MIFAWEWLWGKVVHKRELKMGKVRFPEGIGGGGDWLAMEWWVISGLGYFVC